MEFLLFLLAGTIGSAVFLVGQSVQRRHGYAAAFAVQLLIVAFLSLLGAVIDYCVKNGSGDGELVKRIPLIEASSDKDNHSAHLESHHLQIVAFQNPHTLGDHSHQERKTAFVKREDFVEHAFSGFAAIEGLFDSSEQELPQKRNNAAEPARA